MRFTRYCLFSLSLFLILSNAAFSQTKVSDVKLMGLKGQVKSMVEYSVAVSGWADWILKDKTRPKDHSFFDQEGNLTEKIIEGINTKYIYSKIDGFKTSKTVDLSPREKNREGTFTALGDFDKPKPIEPNEKITKPDKRFEYKFVYETAKDGAVITERLFENNGRLSRKTIYEYTKDGLLTKEILEYTNSVLTSVLIYDDKGALIEVNKTSKTKGSGSNSNERTTYTDIKYDEAGNWIERKFTRYIETKAGPESEVPAKTYTLISIEYRTITYY